MVSNKEIKRRIKGRIINKKPKKSEKNDITIEDSIGFFCPACDCENPIHAKFCQNCGNEFIICPICKSKTINTSEFCLICGKHLKEDLYLKKGLELFNNEEYFEANLFFEKILIKNPKNPQAWFYKGKSLSKIKEFDKALESLDKALENDFEDKTDIWMNKGIILEKLNRIAEATAYFEKILNYINVEIPDKEIQHLVYSTNSRYAVPAFTENQYKIDSHKKEALLKISEFKEKELISNGNIIYIQNFVKNYGNNYKYSELKLLRKLIISKGTEISLDVIRSLIDKELVEIQNNLELNKFNEFKNKIYYNKPHTTKEIIINLLDFYGENYDDYMDLFNRLLSERGEKISDEQFLSILEEIKEEKKLQNFESELLTSTKPFKTPYLNIHDLDNLNGYEFEHFLLLLFNKMGYKAKNTPLSGDQGADLIISKFSEVTVVQAKLYSSKVSNTAVQEVVASIKHYNAHNGLVVTNNEFTQSAKELARSNNIELIDRNKLENLIKQYKVEKKEMH